MELSIALAICSARTPAARNAAAARTGAMIPAAPIAKYREGMDRIVMALVSRALQQILPRLAMCCPDRPAAFALPEPLGVAHLRPAPLARLRGLPRQSRHCRKSWRPAGPAAN